MVTFSRGSCGQGPRATSSPVPGMAPSHRTDRHLQGLLKCGDRLPQSTSSQDTRSLSHLTSFESHTALRPQHEGKEAKSGTHQGRRVQSRWVPAPRHGAPKELPQWFTQRPMSTEQKTQDTRQAAGHSGLGSLLSGRGLLTGDTVGPEGGAPDIHACHEDPSGRLRAALPQHNRQHPQQDRRGLSIPVPVSQPPPSMDTVLRMRPVWSRSCPW